MTRRWVRAVCPNCQESVEQPVEGRVSCGCGQMTLETQSLTPAEICKFQGTAGYAQCWSCPVTTCPLWLDPGSALSGASLEVADKAALRVEAGLTRIPYEVDAFDLVFGTTETPGLVDATVQTALRVRQAAEAVIQGLALPGREAAERKVHNKYINRCMARPDHLATPDDEVWLDAQLLLAVSDIAADEYHAPKKDVAEEVAYMRNLKLRAPKEWRRG